MWGYWAPLILGLWLSAKTGIMKKKIHLNILPHIFFYVNEVLGYSLSPELILPLFSTCAMCSGMSDSLWPHDLHPARLFCPWGFSRQEYWSGLPCPPPGDLPSPVLPHWRQILYQLNHQGNSFPHIHIITHEDLLITSSWIIQAESFNQKNFLKIG